METLIAFLVGVLTSYWFLAIVLVTALAAEYNDEYKSAAVLTAAGLISATLIFNLPYWLLFAYIPSGVIWSFWRWRVHCKKCTALAKEGKLKIRHPKDSWNRAKNPSKEESREALVQETLLLPNLDRILSWIVCFPVSMLESAVDDIIHVLKIAVTEWFSKAYKASSVSALKDFDKVEVEIVEVKEHK